MCTVGPPFSFAIQPDGQRASCVNSPRRVEQVGAPLRGRLRHRKPPTERLNSDLPGATIQVRSIGEHAWTPRL